MTEEEFYAGVREVLGYINVHSVKFTAERTSDMTAILTVEYRFGTDDRQYWRMQAALAEAAWWSNPTTLAGIIARSIAHSVLGLADGRVRSLLSQGEYGSILEYNMSRPHAERVAFRLWLELMMLALGGRIQAMTHQAGDPRYRISLCGHSLNAVFPTDAYEQVVGGNTASASPRERAFTAGLYVLRNSLTSLVEVCVQTVFRAERLPRTVPYHFATTAQPTAPPPLAPVVVASRPVPEVRSRRIVEDRWTEATPKEIGGSCDGGEVLGGDS